MEVLLEGGGAGPTAIVTIEEDNRESLVSPADAGAPSG
jgi:hypothetical protein